MEKHYKDESQEAGVLHDRASVLSSAATFRINTEEGRPSGEETMVRTQIYLTRSEHTFLIAEANRRGQKMSAVIRSIIDERMAIPEEAWTNNPMLDPTPDVAGWEGVEDGVLNHDHYIYGCPKKYEKKKGEWVLSPPIE